MRQEALRIDSLRRQALSATLLKPTTLSKAISRLGFVQADPIRSPARAQDLILRHRVEGYRAGDLEQEYSKLRLEEDFLYAYGFMPRSLWQVLHPRNLSGMTSMERQVLDVVTKHKHVHPRELERYLGREREINAWGAYSKATTRALDSLHYRGLLRVAGRENGIRLYEPVAQAETSLTDIERLTKLVLLIAAVFAPAPIQSLRSILRHLAHAAPGLDGRRAIVQRLLKTGELVTVTVGQVQYLWPAARPKGKPSDADAGIVRFLTPFDPVVWDRRRFEHLWGWPYRFEAYISPAKRQLGYYAMPMLWRTQVVGWVNISNHTGHLQVVPGFVSGQPDESGFQREFDAEVERVRQFLQKRNAGGT